MRTMQLNSLDTSLYFSEMRTYWIRHFRWLNGYIKRGGWNETYLRKLHSLGER